MLVEAFQDQINTLKTSDAHHAEDEGKWIQVQTATRTNETESANFKGGT
jgi:hypothetical protein